VDEKAVKVVKSVLAIQVKVKSVLAIQVKVKSVANRRVCLNLKENRKKIKCWTFLEIN
jgi:hypothetical protein